MTWLQRLLPLIFLGAVASTGLAADGDAVKAEDREKVSNDDPGRPLQMPPATTETKEALEDFERFRKRGAWERALKALYTIKDDQALRFVDGADGFVIPIARKRRELLTALPPEGQAAYRLFYDAEARKLFDQAQGDAERANLERVFSAYFTTTVGAAAADRLGELYFEEGRFDRAADCWLAVLRDRPDSEVPPAAVATKAAVALHRAGRRSEFDRLRAEIEERHGAENVTIAGRTATPPELLRDLISGDPSPAVVATQPADDHPIDLPKTISPAWRFQIAETIEAGMQASELTQWRAGSISSAAPAWTIEGSTLYLNYLGRIQAVDLITGKLRWRTESFHNVEQLANQGIGQMLDPEQFAILARGKLLWTVSRDLKEQNYNSTFQLECRRAEDGEVLWKLSDLPDYAGFQPSGPPLLAGDKLFIPVKLQQNQPTPQQWVVAVRPQDGRPFWKTEIAVSRQGERMYYYSGRRDQTPMVRMTLRSGVLYVDTHAGILARLDADSGSLDWGYAYETAPLQTDRYFSYGYQQQEPQSDGEPPRSKGEALIFKGAKSTRIYAIDPDRMSLVWRRPISKDVRVLGIDGRSIYLGGEEFAALDGETRALSWATRLPGGSFKGAVAIRPDGVWQATPRGVFELDPRTGVIRRIFRGDDLGAEVSDIVTTDDLLLTVSNRAVTAYPRRPVEAPANPSENSPR